MAISKAFALSQAGSDPTTTGTFDSTGATHIVVAVKHESAATTITVSDNKSSTGWTGLTKESHANGDLHTQLFWAEIGSPGTGHTVTADFGAAVGFVSVIVWLITADTDIELIDEANAEGTGTALDAGTLSNPSGKSVVSFMVFGEYSGVTHTGGTGWTEDVDGPPSGNFTAAYSRGPETGTTIDPAGTQSASADWTANAAMFAEVGGGGGGAALSIAAIVQNYRNMGLMQ